MQTSSAPPDSPTDARLSGVLPDSRICHVKLIAETKAFVRCLVNNPISCPYAMGCGNDYLCRNPNWRLFVRS